MSKFHCKINTKALDFFEFETDSGKSRWREYCKNHNGTSLVIEPVVSKRSDQQNKALHVWFTNVSKAFNEAGYTVQLVLKEKIDLDWSPELVKEMLWRPAQKAILKKRSTTELKKLEEIDVVFDHLNRHIGEKFGIHEPFPAQTQAQKDGTDL
jgi:hypothetical protein